MKVLAKYFDAYLCFASWGRCDLAFSFPIKLIDTPAPEVYFDEEHVNIREIEGKQVLKFEKTP
jgi:hypothetical protein